MNIIPLVGPSYISRSLPLSAQVTRGLYPEINQDARTMAALHAFPGLLPWSNLGGVHRGLGIHDGQLYVVNGGVLYAVGNDGSYAVKGYIGGTERCILQSDGYKLFIATGSTQYVYDISVQEVDVVDSGKWVAFLNSQVVYSGALGTFWVSNAGEGDTINPLSYAGAEADPDDIERGYVFNDTLYLIGTRTIESWYNSGVGIPPFDRITGGTLAIGTAARYSVNSNDAYMYLLGDDRNVYQIRGQNSQSISSIGVAHAFNEYSVISDAVGMCITIDGQYFYILSFPTEQKTWAYHQVAGAWFELGYGVDSSLWRGTSAINIYGKTIVADADNGKLYSLDMDTFTDNGQTILRQRTTAPVHGGLYGAPGKRIFMSKLELVLDVGHGLVSGPDPKITMRYSDDGGYTWSMERTAGLGGMGDYDYRAEWRQLGSFYNRIFEFRVTDPVKFSFIEAMADMVVGQ